MGNKITPDQNTETLLTIPELAKILRRSIHSIHKDCQFRRIPFVRVGKRSVRFDPVEIRAFIEKSKVPVRVRS